MFCTKCGAKIDEDSGRCPECGTIPKGRAVVAPEGVAVPNHMVKAILVTLFCCQLGGIVALVYAAQSNNKVSMGDIPGALRDAKTADNWITASIIIGIVAAIVNIALAVIFIAGSATI